MSKLDLKSEVRPIQDLKVGVGSHVGYQDLVGSNFNVEVGCKVESQVDRVSIQDRILG